MHLIYYKSIANNEVALTRYYIILCFLSVATGFNHKAYDHVLLGSFGQISAGEDNFNYRDTAKAVLIGKIKDSRTGEPIMAATVVINGTATGTFSDTTGQFKLVLPENFQKHKISFTISSAGYFRKEFSVRMKHITRQNEFYLTSVSR